MSIHGLWKVILLAILVTALAVACKPSTRERLEEQLKQERSSEPKINVFADVWKEKVALLSCKYDVEPSVLEDLLVEYSDTADTILDVATSALYKPTSRKTETLNRAFPSKDVNHIDLIDSLSKRHGIPKGKIASILIDYRIWSRAEGSRNP